MTKTESEAQNDMENKVVEEKPRMKEDDEIEKGKVEEKMKEALAAERRRDETEVLVLDESVLLGTVGDVRLNDDTEKVIVEVTRDMLQEKRVLRLCHIETTPMTIVFPPELCHSPTEGDDDGKEESKTTRRGFIKIFMEHCRNISVQLQQCKILTGVLEISHCHNVSIDVRGDKLNTIQVDLSSDITLSFGHGVWGGESQDRIYHAGVRNMTIRLLDPQGEFTRVQKTVDYLRDGAARFGNATKEEDQFVTFSKNGGKSLCSDRIIRKSDKIMLQTEMARGLAKKKKLAPQRLPTPKISEIASVLKEEEEEEEEEAGED